MADVYLPTDDAFIEKVVEIASQYTVAYVLYGSVMLFIAFVGIVFLFPFLYGICKSVGQDLIALFSSIKSFIKSRRTFASSSEEDKRQEWI